MNKKTDDQNPTNEESVQPEDQGVKESSDSSSAKAIEDKQEELSGNGCDCEDCQCDKEEKSDEFKEKYIRALADYQNLSKRIDREREEIQKSASEWIVLKLLPVLDDLELAKENIKEKGIELIYNKLWNIIEKEGVKKIKIKEDDEFDPSKMECIDAEDGGHKLITIRNGYIMKGKIIRPAQVKVVK